MPASSRFPLTIARLLVATAACCAPGLARAQSDTPAPPQAGASEAETSREGGDIVVTGRAVPGAVIGDVPPENQLNPADIAAYGVGTIAELLDEIAEQTQSDQGRDSSSGPVVLVNGKRISGINEVSDLPTESVLRVDILPEEVALKYGYDAQQKVVNVLLRRHFRSRVANLGGGLATEGQGGNATGDLTFTRIRDNDRINLSARVQTSASLLESDRGIVATVPSPAYDLAGNITALTGGAEIDPALSALAGSTVTVAGVPAGTASPALGDLSDRANLTDDTGYRTLRPSTRSYTLNGVLAHQLGEKVTASFNARASYATSDGLRGLPGATLTLPADSAYSPFAANVSVARYLSDAALRQHGETAGVRAGVAVNADLSTDWRLSFTGSYDHGETRSRTDQGYDTAALQAAIDAGTASPFGGLSTTLLGDLQTDRATAISDAAGAQLVAMGALFALPAGKVRTSLRVGGDASRLSSRDLRSGLASTSDVTRSDVNAQASLDLPITSRRSGFGSAIGTLTANVNAGVTDVSDYGALGTLGYGLNWTPRTGISLIASVNEDRVAPTLQQLNAPLVSTANVRLYDYVRGETVTVTQLSGGNAALKADDRHVFKLGMSLKPFSAIKLALTANYLDSRIRNAIGTLPGATAAVEAAFPGRYVRDADGVLLQVDSRAVNFARRDREQLRWGVTFTQVLRAPKRPPRPGRPPWMRPDATAGAAATGATAPTEGASRDARQQPGEDAGPAAQERPDMAPGDGRADEEGSEVVVTGRRPSDGDGDFGPPPGEFGPPPDGFGPPDGPPPDGPPPDGPPPGGFGGPGGPGGGPGGPGGGPGGPGGPGFGGGDNGARLQVSVFHSWVFRDTILVREGVPEIDLLHGGTIGAGGQPRHQVQFNTGVTDNGLGVRLSGSWQSATRVDADEASGTGALRFGALATLDLRLFANLAQRFPRHAWARGTRVSFTVGNLFDTRQRVRAADGTTPAIYQPAYLDALGRTLSLSMRRIF